MALEVDKAGRVFLHTVLTDGIIRSPSPQVLRGGERASPWGGQSYAFMSTGFRHEFLTDSRKFDETEI